MEKQCSNCSLTLPLDLFYKSSGYKGGYTKRCKDCTKIKARERELKILSTPEGIEKERKRHRDKYYRLNYKEKHKPTYEAKKIAIDRYNNKYPEKLKAKNKTLNINPKVKGNHLHHWSYNEEHYKDVIELSDKDHYKAHRFIVYDQEFKMYRKHCNNELLDTKKKHLNYIENFIK